MTTRVDTQARLQAFWDSGEKDWSVFDDVPPEQLVDVMYPHRIVALDIQAYLDKQALNVAYGKLS